MHTERIINKSFNYHSCTALFTKTFFDKVVLINSNWKHLNHIQAAKIMTPYPSFSMYKPYNQTFTSKRHDFIGMQEENIPSNFKSLIKQGVKVEPYDTATKEHQANPDTVFIFKNGNFTDQRTRTLYQKTNNPGLGNNKILSEITTERYRSTIDRFENELKSKRFINNNILTALLQLKETSYDFEKHQISWAKILYLFPDNFIPPLKIPQNFSYAQIYPEALHQINKQYENNYPPKLFELLEHGDKLLKNMCTAEELNIFIKELEQFLKEKLTYISRDLYEALYLLKQYKNKIPDDAVLAIEKFLMTDPIITPYTLEQRAYEIQRYKEAIYILEKWSNKLPDAVFLEIIRRSGIIVNNQASCEYDDSGPWSDLWNIANKQITREKSEGFSMHTDSYREIERQRDKYMVFNELPLNQEQRKEFINNIRNKCFSAEIKTEYSVVTTKIKDDTSIPRSGQMHMLIVKGDPDTDETVEAIAMLTSQAAIKTGGGVIENIKIDDTQVSGQKKKTICCNNDTSSTNNKNKRLF